jgi:hypothetical protein
MAMTQLVPIGASHWDGEDLRAQSEHAQRAVEQGEVLHFRSLPFLVTDAERAMLDPRVADPRRKNISLEPDGRTLRGVVGGASNETAVTGLVARFQEHAARLVDTLCPSYRGRMRVAPASLRVHSVQGRPSSWRKDDSRLHIDAFPSRPLAGERILRVFMNINPHGVPRVWRVGESFEDVARRFLPQLPRFRPWAASVLAALGVTKRQRTPYDHFMLGLHDAMKADLDYQRDCEQQTVPFAPGDVWVCYSDQTSHAVMSGQHMLEQTLFLPVEAMRHPHLAPLSVLERLRGERLV